LEFRSFTPHKASLVWQKVKNNKGRKEGKSHLHICNIKRALLKDNKTIPATYTNKQTVLGTDNVRTKKDAGWGGRGCDTVTSLEL
jgi:hypothetical protein